MPKRGGGALGGGRGGAPGGGPGGCAALGLAGPRKPKRSFLAADCNGGGACIVSAVAQPPTPPFVQTLLKLPEARRGTDAAGSSCSCCCANLLASSCWYAIGRSTTVGAGAWATTALFRWGRLKGTCTVGRYIDCRGDTTSVPMMMMSVPQLPNGADAAATKPNDRGAMWIQNVSQRPGARMKQLKDRPEVKAPLDAAINTKGKLQRASFPLLQKLKLARRKKVYTNCNNKQGPPTAAALVVRGECARTLASLAWHMNLVSFPKTLTNSGDYTCHPPRGIYSAHS